jgi:ATP-binding cassette, subfamily F, member 3
MLSVNNLTLIDRTTDVVLVKDLSFTLREGERIAIIGSEGTGKSTLLQTIVKGPPDHVVMEGSVIRDQTIGHMPQALSPAQRQMTVHQYLESKSPDERSLAEALKRLHMNGFDASKRLDRTMATLSGGERIKVLLAAALINRPDVLCLDEPSNDLDFDAIRWLEEALMRDSRPVIFISHDRMLLSNVATGIIHLRQIRKGRVADTVMERVPYDTYVPRRASRDQATRMVGLKQRAEHKKTMERHRQIYQKVEYRQNQAVRDPSTARLLKKRMHVLKSQERRHLRDAGNFLDIPEDDEPMNVFFDQMAQHSHRQTALDVHLSHLELPDGRRVSSLDLVVSGTDKVVITGRNGTGKSTFVKRIAHDLIEKGVRVGMIPQTYQDVLPDSETAVDHVTRTGGTSDHAAVRRMLGSLGFRREDMDVPSRALSEGQKLKAILLGIVIRPSDILILDEPTRNISPINLDKLTELFKAFDGPILAVSHDRRFISDVFDRVLVMDEHGLRESSHHNNDAQRR